MFDFDLEEMVQQQLVSRGVHDQRVIAAFREVPRTAFVPEYLHNRMYGDESLPIGLGQTISPPYVSARMLQSLELKADSRVLEVGTGSGYLTAMLACLAAEVMTIEYLPELSARARKLLVDDLGVDNVTFLVGDGFQGWSDRAPFDAILVNAAAEEVPWPLEGQLRARGRLVMPLGDREQRLVVLERPKSGGDPSECYSEPIARPFPLLEGEAQD
ncbi:MAG: protein-L-isoaspartate(D-aspartate) O-methyltransferase [Myxococcota bacterium]|nr:protein-L-isoaspartate(D-aspartate) O-methyltransferase [Myxococcota bacterium]